MVAVNDYAKGIIELHKYISTIFIDLHISVLFFIMNYSVHRDWYKTQHNKFIFDRDNKILIRNI